MAVEISGVTLCPTDDLITGAWLDTPQRGSVDRYAFDVNGWVVSKAPVAEVEFVHEEIVIARCELDVSRPDVAKQFGSSSQVGFWKAIGTVGLTPAFAIEVRVVFQDGRQDVIAEIRGTQIDIERPKDWDEEAYLRENPDVAQQVRNHPETNGWEHFATFGYLENRRGVPPKFFDYVQSYRKATIKPAAPARLRKRVSLDENLQFFESTGRKLAANVFGQLMRVGPYGEDFRILDFGVGCGRVIRPLHELCLDAHLTDGKLHWFGSDIDAEAITWCRSVIESIGTFVLNSPMPPLPFDDQYFDFVYCLSIFTHLPEDMQFAWLSELRRVMRIGSFAVLSTHSTDLIPAFVKVKLRNANPEFYYHVVGDTEGLPSFYQASYHSHEYIHKRWSEYFAVRKIIPKGIACHQELVLCQRVD
jgi:ubiquinone/menaquinone biosynthesis C-methylase UbiE